MYSEIRTLSAILGSPALALFEAFAFRQGIPLTPAQASRFSGVAWATAHRKIIDWESSGILRPVGKDGKGILYVLNNNSETVRVLAKALQIAVTELYDSEEKTETPLPVTKVPTRQVQVFKIGGELENKRWKIDNNNRVLSPGS